MIEQDNTRKWLDNIDTEYLICAHTHFPGEMKHNGKHYFNSGCVGIAIKDCGFAQCMVLEDIKTSGLIDKAPWFINSNIQILLTGIDHSSELVSAASNKTKEIDKKSAWPWIEEKYFEAAAKELGIPDYNTIK